MSSKAASRRFIFMYFLLPHWVPTTWRSRTQTNMRAELPSGKLRHQLHFGVRRHREHIAVKVDRTPLVLGSREHFSHGFQHTQAPVPYNKFYSIQTAAAEPLEEAAQLGLSSFMPSVAPKISRYPSSLTTIAT